MSREEKKRRIYEILLALHENMKQTELWAITEEIAEDPDFDKNSQKFIYIMQKRLDEQQQKKALCKSI